jgi:hypothetical protein
VALSLAGCHSEAADDAAIELPEPNAAFDYQLGGAYEPAADVATVVRDRTDPPAAGRYNVCYVNGFQTQPGEAAYWLEEHPDLLVRDAEGQPLVDPDYPDEMLLDPSTSEQRAELVSIVGRWIDGCAAAGFDAVEIDNLGNFARFPDQLTEDATVSFARRLVDRAHRAGLAIAQKNSPELLARRWETGFDFALVEQCNEFDECVGFTERYGDEVYVIEYDRDAFERGCRDHPELAIVLRDRALVLPDTATYVRRAC